MWGPCRDVALERQTEERLAGYDAQTLNVALSRTYDDCVSGDRRVHVHSIYKDPAPAVPAEPVTAARGARSSSFLLKSPD